MELPAGQTIITQSTRETIQLGKRIGAVVLPGTIITLIGDLGSGKTTLVKGIAIGLGITQEITSPTFTIFTEYTGKYPLYHFDLYRIKSFEEFEQLGIEPMLFGTGVSVVEWSERILSFLPKEHGSIKIRYIEKNTREIQIQGIKM